MPEQSAGFVCYEYETCKLRPDSFFAHQKWIIQPYFWEAEAAERAVARYIYLFDGS